MDDHDLFLGHDLGDGARVWLDPDHLTTHAVCFGMTGSGKTGLGIVALEELARRGVALLVIDLKGDMVDLLLNFPSLAAEEFEPWLTSDLVRDRDRAEVAEEQAALWRQGLARSGLGPDDLSAVRNGVRWRLLTPGAAAVAPVDILPSLSSPPGWSPDRDPDGAADRSASVAGALLSLVGRGGDPLTDRDQVLVASILLEHWRRGDTLDLARLIASVADPPMAALGVLPVEQFYPRSDRMALVMELNALVASPAFASWTTGTPLTMESLVGNEGEPRASILSLAHLDERQRRFILSLVVSELVAWMRRLPGTNALRALIYIDELHGMMPPHPANPPTKGPLLTVLKQGRAFGVGAWLATQNPVDIDYKAVGNAGVTVIGRLVTARDRDRVLDGLGLRTTSDGRDADALVASLGKREFVLHDVRDASRTRIFASRWAMSYLRGPVTLAEMAALVPARAAAAEAPAREDGAAAGRPVGQANPPVLGTAVEQRFAAAAAGMASPSLVVRDRLTVSRASIGLDRALDEIWQVPLGGDGGLDWPSARALEALPRVVPQPPQGMEFPSAAPGRLDSELARVERAFLDWRARTPVSVLGNSKLKLAAEPGESRAAFEQRCLELADRADDDAQARAQARYGKRMESLGSRLAKERAELQSDREEVRTRKAEEVFGVVEGLFSVLLGSRSASSAGRKAASRMRTAAGKRRMSQRAEADVDESMREIERIESELEEMAAEMESEVARIAAESEEKARSIEEIEIRPKKTHIAVEELFLLWS